jgi:hypothetical protein
MFWISEYWEGIRIGMDMYIDLDDSLAASEGDKYLGSLIVCNGANGLNGLNGLPGVQGPMGPQGPPT